MSDVIETWAVTNSDRFPSASRYGLRSDAPRTGAIVSAPDAELSAVIDQLYEASAGDDRKWEPALIALREAFGSVGGQIVITVPETRQFYLNWTVAQGLGLIDVKAYEDYSFDDPLVPAFLGMLRTTYCSDVHFRDEVVKDRITLLKIPDAFGRFMALSFLIDKTMNTLAVLRGKDDPPFSFEDCERLQTLLPDFERLGAILAMRRSVEARPKAAIAALDRLSGAYGLVRGTGEIVFLNGNADNALKGFEENSTSDRQWVSACINAIRAGRSHYHISGREIRLSRLADPNSTQQGVYHDYFQDMVLVDLTAFVGCQEAQMARVSADFGLTNSEREVLSLLASGDDIQGIAIRRSTSLETARAQLRSIRQKTRLSKREQLVALALG